MRRGPSLKRQAEPDPIYNSVLVSQIINQVLLDGKKDLASGIGRDELVAMARKGDNLAVIELEEHRGRDAKTGQKKFGVGARISRKVK